MKSKSEAKHECLLSLLLFHLLLFIMQMICWMPSSEKPCSTLSHITSEAEDVLLIWIIIIIIITVVIIIIIIIIITTTTTTTTIIIIIIIVTSISILNVLSFIRLLSM